MKFTKEQISELMCKHAQKEKGPQIQIASAKIMEY